MSLTPELSLMYTWDSNIGQNITNYADGYATPTISLTLYRSSGPVTTMLCSEVNYENHVLSRDPNLNAPFLYFWGLFKYSFSSWEMKVLGYYSDYFSPDWQLTKVRYKVAPGVEKEIGRSEFSLDIPLSVYDYGGFRDDHLIFEVEGEYLFDFKVLKSWNFAVREISLSAGYEMKSFLAKNDESSGDEEAAYQAIGGKISGEIKLWRFALEPSFDISRKIYDKRDNHTRTEKLTRRVNMYYDLGLDCEVELSDFLTLELGGVYKIKQSTYSIYDYRRYVFDTRLTLEPKFVLSE